jgi:hypothetical protein
VTRRKSAAAGAAAKRRGRSARRGRGRGRGLRECMALPLTTRGGVAGAIGA